jgi:hypothetical protein
MILELLGFALFLIVEVFLCVVLATLATLGTTSYALTDKYTEVVPLCFTTYLIIALAGLALLLTIPTP